MRIVADEARVVAAAVDEPDVRFDRTSTLTTDGVTRAAAEITTSEWASRSSAS